MISRAYRSSAEYNYFAGPDMQTNILITKVNTTKFKIIATPYYPNIDSLRIIMIVCIPLTIEQLFKITKNYMKSFNVKINDLFV